MPVISLGVHVDAERRIEAMPEGWRRFRPVCQNLSAVPGLLRVASTRLTYVLNDVSVNSGEAHTTRQTWMQEEGD